MIVSISFSRSENPSIIVAKKLDEVEKTGDRFQQVYPEFGICHSSGNFVEMRLTEDCRMREVLRLVRSVSAPSS